MHVCICTYGAQRTISGVAPQVPSTCFLMTESLTSLELTKLANMVAQQAMGVHWQAMEVRLSLSLWFCYYKCVTARMAFYMWVLVTNSSCLFC